MIHMFDHVDVLLYVDYTPGDDGIPTINQVKVTDSCYRPVGPDLSQMLNSAVVLYEEQGDGVREATPILSLIVEEIANAHEETARVVR